MSGYLQRFLADDRGCLVAQDWILVGTILLLGSALCLMAWQRSLEPPLPSALPVRVTSVDSR